MQVSNTEVLSPTDSTNDSVSTSFGSLVSSLLKHPKVLSQLWDS